MKRRVAVWAGVVLFLALATWARIWIVDHLRDQGWFAHYIASADRILADDLQQPDVTSPYLWCIVVLRAIGLGVTSIRNLQIAGVTLAALLCALAAGRLGGRIAAIAAAVLVLGSRAALVVATEFEPETLTLILASAALFFLVRRQWIAAAVLFIAVALHSTHPGAAFYAGNNPLSTGCAGVFPQVVSDLKTTPELITDWAPKAFANVRMYPGHALSVVMWKAILTVHHYDAYDLITTKRKNDELARWPAIPFGVAFVLAIAAFVLSRRRRELLPVALFAAVVFLALVTFNVSARTRNVLLAPLAILGGVGAAEIVALARTRSERGLIAFGAVMVVAPMLGIEGGPIREDRYTWSVALREAELREQAMRARARGDEVQATKFAAAVSILDTADPPLVTDVTLRSGALVAAKDEESPRRLFDIAIALEKANAWREADAILSTIGDYRPHRENRAVSSVSYYRARAALRLRGSNFRALIDAAEREAPGDPHVLALRAVTVEREAARRLDALYDPFTRDFALASAYLDTGDQPRAIPLFVSLARRVPEWQRPAATLRHALRTASPRSGSSGVGR